MVLRGHGHVHADRAPADLLRRRLADHPRHEPGAHRRYDHRDRRAHQPPVPPSGEPLEHRRGLHAVPRPVHAHLRLLRHDQPDPAAEERPPPAGRRPRHHVRARLLLLRSGDAPSQGHRFRGPRRKDVRHRRALRQRQEHGRQPAPAAVRRGRRLRADRSRRTATCSTGPSGRTSSTRSRTRRRRSWRTRAGARAYTTSSPASRTDTTRRSATAA